jgi:hypothetical protein
VEVAAFSPHPRLLLTRRTPASGWTQLRVLPYQTRRHALSSRLAPSREEICMLLVTPNALVLEVERFRTCALAAIRTRRARWKLPSRHESRSPSSRQQRSLRRCMTACSRYRDPRGRCPSFYKFSQLDSSRFLSLSISRPSGIYRHACDERYSLDEEREDRLQHQCSGGRKQPGYPGHQRRRKR